MKKYASLLSILLITAVIYWSFSDMKPSVNSKKTASETEFSLNSALVHLKKISQKTHYVGSQEHKVVQNYIVNELKKLGLNPEIQQQVAVNSKWLAATNTENILAKIKGTHTGKALLLLTHYDSSPHSSLGASDAGSGVVTILEGLRAFLANNKQPKNDIIILISDAEELGLLGAKAFVDTHPWAKEVGLVLNFEARGSGGPSYMLMETNGKNGKLLSEFIKAKPNYPVASSLMYSIYKKLPNDTDLTVFRENANINGFNFAFIGDHFDYHTAQDSYERLDRETLLHQADYFTTMLNYFAYSDLQNLESNQDLVYVNFPFIKLLSYPFSWIFPMLIIAIILFIGLLILGIALNKITLKGLLKGGIPFLVSLLLCGGVSFGFWKLLLVIHPQYQDILHGFTYNGYLYISAVVFLNLWILLKIYSPFYKDEKPINLLIVPIFIWLIINFYVWKYLQGAGFFIIPVLSALLILTIAIFRNLNRKFTPFLFTILSIPTLYIFAPLVKMFPVGLGLKSLFISAVFIVLLFGLLTPIFIRKKATNRLRKTAGYLTFLCIGLATYNSGFSVDHKKPNSLVYVQNSNTKTAYFGTYNNVLDSYTKQIFNKNDTIAETETTSTTSKYNTRFKKYKKTVFKNISTAVITIQTDTIIAHQRHIELLITPQRKINKLEFRTKNKVTFNQLKINGVFLEKVPFSTRKGAFLTYSFGNLDSKLALSFSVKKESNLEIVLKEISYDLLSNLQFDLQPRTAEMMPMPFVTNDAIICIQEINL
ncbi:MAG: M20/M25/M40 family metallo-hydrolase [Polaribacter sp.]|nr:M20/M25/M40 family metallo-hydrolase [Polaribacter sp.]